MVRTKELLLFKIPIMHNNIQADDFRRERNGLLRYTLIRVRQFDSERLDDISVS